MLHCQAASKTLNITHIVSIVTYMYVRDKISFITYCRSNVSHRKGVRLKAKQVKPFYILLSNKNQVLKTGIGGKGYKILEQGLIVCYQNFTVGKCHIRCSSGNLQPPFLLLVQPKRRLPRNTHSSYRASRCLNNGNLELTLYLGSLQIMSLQ